MKVKCIQNVIDSNLAKQVDFPRRAPTDYRSEITIGKEYVVLGLCYIPSSLYWAGKPAISIKDDDGDLSFVPIFLFEIIDPRPSKFWQIRYNDDGSLEMYPEAFYRNFFHDDLSEGVPEIKADFIKICEKLEKEQAESLN